MEKKFSMTFAQEESGQFIEAAKKTHPESIISGKEVRAYLREGKHQ
jgi:hypothetical protein